MMVTRGRDDTRDARARKMLPPFTAQTASANAVDFMPALICRRAVERVRQREALSSAVLRRERCERDEMMNRYHVTPRQDTTLR